MISRSFPLIFVRNGVCIAFVRSFLAAVAPRPGEWFVCEGTEWRLFEEALDWEGAERECQRHNAHLANLETNTAITSCAKNATHTCFRNGRVVQQVYVGLANLFDTQSYRWINTNVLSNLSSRPDLQGFTRAICMTYVEDGNRRFFVDCPQRFPFICEREIG